ncbi:MarR family winged helix-turn-helix transcriptional regulator [Rhodococcus globerulus]|uniref:MarR family transcriptional regulator n=1 Tax=Rhodococcus globerulus TaxID=33008 RepID=A0ABU4C4P3_RHOGO|nr:MarR family transcriptional regulator [Rhodococcus globerulus]MDV6271480.1 MarR family transcriptional regulator [Rhodococcus globerulus]
MEEQERAAMVATEVMTAMTRLRARLRAESGPSSMPWTWSQLTTLARIINDGPTTASALAQAEYVRRQSMAETIAALRSGGLITSYQDPDDGRKTVISATEKGRNLSETIPAVREEWLAARICEKLNSREKQILSEAASIMERIADS